MDNVSILHTEQRNPDTIGITQLSTLDMLRKINDEDKKVAFAVEQALPQVEKAVELIASRMNKGGRMVYVAAGTSGRLGYMDSSEVPPTYGMPYDAVTCVMAGGKEAVFRAKENVEDQPQRAQEDLIAFGLTALDTVVAVAASGRTPYCVGALDYAKSIGAGTVSVSCNPNAVMSSHAEAPIEVDTGAEVVMGSTRMKAGTAQKMILNMLSTGTMLRIGRTHDNIMVCMHCHNAKVANRSIRMFLEATGCGDRAVAEKYLQNAEGEISYAAIMYLTGCTLEAAKAALAKELSFDRAVEALGGRA